MTKNAALNSAIFLSPFNNREVAKKIGKDPSWVSKVIHGTISQVSGPDRKELAKILKVKEEEIFTESG